MLFSVIIPVFNRAAILPTTLASVWSQSCADYEVIVVDDGSTDGTSEYLAALGARIKVLRQSRQGPGAARNAAAAVAAGEYLAFLDSDDLWFPWTLQVFARLIAENKQPAILASVFREFTKEAELTAIRDEPIQHERHPDFLRSAASSHSIGAGTVLIRRSVFLDSGGFTTLPINCEDHDFMLRVGSAPGFVLVEAPIVLGHRRHQGNMTADLTRTVEGARYLLSQERRNAYAGGTARAAERRKIIARHLRPVTLACARNGRLRAGVALYFGLLSWHLRLRQWKYLAGLPLLAAWHAIGLGRRDTNGGR